MRRARDVNYQTVSPPPVSTFAEPAVRQQTGRHGRVQRALEEARSWLSKRSAAWWIVALALGLHAAAVPTGRVLDDNFHAVALQEEGGALGVRLAPWDLFAFAKDPASIKAMIDQGIYPWWSDLQARFSFFRPLTSLTIWLDYQLWPRSPAWMHVHSLLWYAWLLYVISRVYRRFGASPVLATLALAIYALDDARSMTVGWVANRSVLLALSGGFAALLAHDRWRRTGRARWLAASVSALGVGLLCAEAALQAVGYLVAYALFLEGGKTAQRAWSLAPYGVVIVGWRAVYTALGYGATGTELYIDPGSSPLRFAEAALARLPVLFAAQFTGIPADLGDLLKYFAPGWEKLVLPLGVACTLPLLWLFSPLWRGQREVRFWATGSLLSTIPVCAVAASDRLLAATAVGGSALLAQLLVAIADRMPAYRHRLALGLGLTLAFVHLVAAPLLLPLRSYSLVYFGQYIARAEESLPDGPQLADQTLVMLNPPSDEYGIYVPFHRKIHGGVMPARMRWLATGDHALQITRLDRFSLQIRPAQGFLPPGSLWTLRSAQKRSFVGETLELTGVRYRITDVTPDGRPAEVVARFDAPLDSERFVWLRWGERSFVPWSPPQPGQSATIPAVDFRKLSEL